MKPSKLPRFVVQRIHIRIAGTLSVIAIYSDGDVVGPFSVEKGKPRPDNDRAGDE